MQRLLLSIFTLFLATSAFSQADSKAESIQILKGRIINVIDKKPLQSAHILNLNSVEGTITNRKGKFNIPAKANDTIFISYIGYQSIKLRVTSDLLKGNQLEIAIHPKTTHIDEVTVKAHNLIGVLVVDAKNVPSDKYSRIHIDGLPQAYEIGRPQAKEYTSIVSAVFNPLDFWYQKFGKKSKELKKLRKLKGEDQLRGLMEERFGREVLMNYMDMSRKDLDDLLKECNYSSNFSKKASDLQVIEAVIECYENYRAVKEGSVTREKIRINNTQDKDKN